MALNDRVGPQLPGSDNEQFNYGLDYSGLASEDASIGSMPAQLLPTDQNMGALSSAVGMTADHDSMFNSDGSSGFHDNTTPNPPSQFDSMAQLAPGTMPAPQYQLADGRALENIGYNVANTLPTVADVDESVPVIPGSSA